MNIPSSTLDLLTIPLNGLHVIEASAGTGKTFTLAALYVRIVLGHLATSSTLQSGLLPTQILVMTFTDAATAELRARIRQRLSTASIFFRRISHLSMQEDTDSEQQALKKEDQFLWDLAQSIQKDQYALAADRLEVAAQWMDDAAIYTIHAWSSRMLKEHAFDSGALFQQHHAQDAEQMKLRAAQDYWRQNYYSLNASQSQLIFNHLSDPEALLKRVKVQWFKARKSPDSKSIVIQELPAILQLHEEWGKQYQELLNQIRQLWTPEFIALIHDGMTQRWLRGPTSHWSSRLTKVNDWLQGGTIEANIIGYFIPLQNNPQLQAFQPLLSALEMMQELMNNEPDLQNLLLTHAAERIKKIYEQEKKSQAQFDFDDLLIELFKALQSSDGRLAKAIAKQFPIALVDEFQDTDPWQYGALQKIYTHSSAQSSEPTEGASAQGLMMIGDPKQAIYGFRGADINTYLIAREQVSQIYTLGYNYRSNEWLVNAVNSIFSQTEKPAFGKIEFQKVQAFHQNPEGYSSYWNEKPKSAFTVWYLENNNGISNVSKLTRQLAEISASHITDLLNKKQVQAGEIAILVKDKHQAAAMRKALSQRAVPSVYLSEKESVFESSEALDIWRVLRAVAHPQNLSWVKAALATRLWGLSWQQLDFYLQDETAWDQMLERFVEWQIRWKQQGVLAMLHTWLHEEKISQRLRIPAHAAQQGQERVLSNILHLAELLQNASMHLQGETALVRYLEEQIQHAHRSQSDDSYLLRLESDENLVKVITIHKSKGLEYPYVFLPFVSLYKKLTSPATAEEIEQQLYESIRLLYVALTRAKHALFMTVTEINKEFPSNSANRDPHNISAISFLLGRKSNEDLAMQLKNWQSSEFISVEKPPKVSNMAYQSQSSLEQNHRPAAINQRTHSNRWWTASFSAISKGVASYSDTALMHDPLALERLEESHTENQTTPEDWDEPRPYQQAQVRSTSSPTVSQPASNESDKNSVTFDKQSSLPSLLSASHSLNDIKGGAELGTMLHDLLEWQAHHDWILARVPESITVLSWQQLQDHPALMEQVVDHQDYLKWLLHFESKLALNKIELHQFGTINRWLYQVITNDFDVRTENPFRLAALQRWQIWPEMAFTLPIKKLNAQRIDAWVSAYLHPKEPRPALNYLPLEGMMTGFMDLVVLHDNRYFILDYKSNKLEDYSTASMTQGMLHHRYEVQYTLYILALHRLLQVRLKDYRYEQHIGGAIYLFLRGIEQNSQGLYFHLPDFALIDALDQLFKNPAALELDMPLRGQVGHATQASLWSSV